MTGDRGKRVEEITEVTTPVANVGVELGLGLGFIVNGRIRAQG